MKGTLKAVDLEKRFGSKKAVDKVSVKVEKGEIVGLLGPNGAGKTTTFSMISGLFPGDSGRVFLHGEDITEYPMYIRARKGMGLLPQEPSSFRKLTVEENLMAVMEALVPGALARRDRVARTIEEFGLRKVARSMACSLSGGERRRLEIARAMIVAPEFLLLDEPFTGIDPLAVQDLQGMIEGLRSRGIGIMLTDHSVRATLHITDRAYILDKGMVLEEGPPDKIVASEAVRKSYLGDKFRL